MLFLDLRLLTALPTGMPSFAWLYQVKDSQGLQDPPSKKEPHDSSMLMLHPKASLAAEEPQLVREPSNRRPKAA